MTSKFIYRLEEKNLPASVGSKALNLRRMHDKKFRVPSTLICTCEAYERYQNSDPGIFEQVKTELHNHIDPDRTYAVRSSADIEDSLEHSFAGQFKTILDIRGLDKIIASIQDVWDTASSHGVQSYRERLQKDEKQLHMGVIIQQMVPARVSGVSFSKNPITAADEIIIEAVKGSGEALVQDGMTPMRWVNKWGNWIVEPSHCDLPAHLIDEVAEDTRKIKHTFHQDVDLEWTYDGAALHWLQMRDITSARDVKIFSNRISKEMLPGMIKPLVWSVNIPITNGQWARFVAEATGDDSIEPTSLAKPFYFRTYFDMGTFGKIFDSLGLPRESIEMMMGIVPPGAGKPPFKPRLRFFMLLPRLAGFLLNKWKFTNRLDKELNQLDTSYHAYTPEYKDARTTLASLDRLIALHRQATHANIITPMTMSMVNAVLARRLKRYDIDIQSIDLSPEAEIMKQFNPNLSLEQLNQQFSNLPTDVQAKIASCDLRSFHQIPGIEDFQKQVDEFIQTFGHLSDSGVDFSYVPWREKPDLLFKMIKNYQKTESTSKKLRFEELGLSGLGAWFTHRLYQRARRFRLYREQISSIYTYGLDLIRQHYLALGEFLVHAGILRKADEIFFLKDDEIRSYIAGVTNGANFAELVATRKQDMQHCEHVVLPEVIYGDTPPPVIEHRGDILTGTPTSSGYYTGHTRVILGIDQFDKMQTGDVLVIPFSDVGWTPLFAKAGAVIAESGGLLSHSSIIAREYGIPAVVSVAGALSIGDDTLVSIDGYKGEILIQESHKVNEGE